MTVMNERIWLLNRWWGLDGWSAMRGLEEGAKKWEAHKAWLVKHGHLERDDENPDWYRITDKGRALLMEEQPK